MNMQFNPAALNSQLAEVICCTTDKAEIAMGAATFIIEHATTTEWYDIETPDGYNTGKRDVEACTKVSKVSVWCMDGLEIDVTSAFMGENTWEMQQFVQAIEREMERQERTTGMKSEPDYDFMNDDLWERRTDVKPCPSFAHLQSHKS